MPPDMAYLRLKSGVFRKTCTCCSPSLIEAKKFRPIGGTFGGRRPLTGRGWGADLNSQMPLKNTKIRSLSPLNGSACFFPLLDI